MPQAKQASKQRRVAKAAVPALGAAGLSVGLVGGAFASATPTADVPQKLNVAPTQAVTLDEEEMADVSLATFICAGDIERAQRTTRHGNP